MSRDSGKQSRKVLAEKLNTSGAHGITGIIIDLKQKEAETVSSSSGMPG